MKKIKKTIEFSVCEYCGSEHEDEHYAKLCEKKCRKQKACRHSNGDAYCGYGYMGDDEAGYVIHRNCGSCGEELGRQLLDSSAHQGVFDFLKNLNKANHEEEAK